MTELTYEDLLETHDIIIDLTGGIKGILDENVLKSSIANIYQKVFGTELYPSIEEKAARLCYSLATTQGFIDGNKRVALAAMANLLAQNDYVLDCTDDELIKTGLDLANKKMSYEELLLFVKNH